MMMERDPRREEEEEAVNMDDELVTQHPVPMDGPSKACESSHGGADKKRKAMEVNGRARLGSNASCHCVIM
jgi:hypothetical protein